MNTKVNGDNAIQKELNRLLIIVQKQLKKKMFPRKHKKLLRHTVSIKVDKLESPTVGRYETIKDENCKYRYSHSIIIDNIVYDEFKNGLYNLGFQKRWTRKRIKDIIAHELIHAYVHETYEFDEYGYHFDGSPIFLSIITFLGIPSGHKAMESFKYTETYKKVKGFSSFNELENFLILEEIKYNDKFKELQVMIDGSNYYHNIFRFSTGDVTGLEGISTISHMKKDSFGKANTFIIGANADIDNLKELVSSKIDRNVFKNKFTLDNCATIEDRKYKLKLQSMNI